MDITTEQLFENIGRLYIEARYLNKIVAEQQQESVLRAKKEKEKKDKE